MLEDVQERLVYRAQVIARRQWRVLKDVEKDRVNYCVILIAKNLKGVLYFHFNLLKAYIETDIQKYSPAPGDLAYPEKLVIGVSIWKVTQESLLDSPGCPTLDYHTMVDMFTLAWHESLWIQRRPCQRAKGWSDDDQVPFLKVWLLGLGHLKNTN